MSRTTDSTSSGMCVQRMESDVSISSMMFGLTCAELLLVIGVLEMSVCAAFSGVTIIAIDANATARKRKATLRSAALLVGFEFVHGVSSDVFSSA